jgi:hypothetical protein
VSHEELHAQAPFQQADLQTKRWLGDMQLLGCSGDVAHLDDFAEVSELPQINFTPPSLTVLRRLTPNASGDYSWQYNLPPPGTRQQDTSGTGHRDDTNKPWRLLFLGRIDIVSGSAPQLRSELWAPPRGRSQRPADGKKEERSAIPPESVDAVLDAVGGGVFVY